MISLGGLGAAPGGYQVAQQNMQMLRQKEQEQQAMAAVGAALAALAQQGQGGGQPSMPGQTMRLGMAGAPTMSQAPQMPLGGGAAPLAAAMNAQGMNAQPTTRPWFTPRAQPQAAPTGVQQVQGVFNALGPKAWLPPGQGQVPAQASPPGGGQNAGAIAGIESGGDYGALGPVTKTGDRAYGKYQVMGANVPVWTQEVLGQSMTPQQFLANPQAQDAVFQKKFGDMTAKHGSPQAAALEWFAGPGGTPQSTDQLGTSGQAYVDKFNGGAGQPQIKLPSTQGVQPGSLTWPAVVNAIKSANPKISPAVLAQAVNQFVPLMDKDSQEKWKAIDEARANKETDIKARAAGIPSGYEADPDVPGGIRPIAGGPADTEIQNVKSMVSGWIDGTVPVPPLTAVSSSSKTMVAAKAEAKRQGFDLVSAARDITALTAYLRSANGSPQIKMRESIGTVEGSLGRLQDLVGQWDAGGFPVLNSAILATAKQGVLGPKANQIATLLEGQVAETRATLASAVMGGNTPTDAAFRLAADQLKANWSRQTLDAAIEQARANLQFRRQAMNSVGPVGMSGAGPSQPVGGTPAPAAAAAPAGPQEGSTATGPNGQRVILRNGKWEPLA